MTTRKRALTAQIKPDTRNAIMDQLAAAADEIVRLKKSAEWRTILNNHVRRRLAESHARPLWKVAIDRMRVLCRWCYRFAWWRS